jgi:hypothetical protein
MADDFSSALSVDVLAASIALERGDTATLLSQLAQKFQAVLPKNTQIKRQMLGMGSITSVTLCFDDAHYEASRSQYGTLSTRVVKVVRGVQIKTTEVPNTDWNQQVAESLARLATQSADVRDALQQFILG